MTQPSTNFDFNSKSFSIPSLTFLPPVSLPKNQSLIVSQLRTFPVSASHLLPIAEFNTDTNTDSTDNLREHSSGPSESEPRQDIDAIPHHERPTYDAQHY